MSIKTTNPKRRITWLIACLFIALSPVLSQWHGDATVADTRICTALSNEQSQRLVSIKDGGAICFFTSKPGAGGRVEIRAQAIDSSGVVLWGEPATPLAITSVNSEKMLLDAVADGDTAAFVAWMDLRDVIPMIYVQKLTAGGQVVWTNNGVAVNTSNINERYNARLAADGTGGVFVVWDEYFYNTETKLYTELTCLAQRINISGQKVWSAAGVPVSTAPGFRWLPSVTTSADGMIIFFTDMRNATQISGGDFTHYDVYAQKMNLTGQRLWSDTAKPVAKGPDNHFITGDIGKTRYSIADGESGAYILMENFGTPGAAQNALHLQRVNQNGDTIWQQQGGVQVEGTKPGGKRVIKIVGLPGQGAWVVWASQRQDESQLFTMLAQRYSPAGVPLSVEGGMAVSGANAVALPFFSEAVADSTGGVVVTWHENEPAGDKIVAQRANPAGGIDWDPSGVPICLVNEAWPEEPSISLSTNGSSIISWLDKRNTVTSQTDIYAAMLGANGALVGPNAPQTEWITTANGNWDNPATWVRGTVPATNAKVKIRHAVAININVACKSMTVEQPAGAVTVNPGIVVELIK